jgi:hypothetical protein
MEGCSSSPPEPQREHPWLQQLVGEWTSEATMPSDEGGDPDRTRGTESVRGVGALWFRTATFRRLAPGTTVQAGPAGRVELVRLLG